MSMIEVRGLKKTYYSSKADTYALRGIDMDIHEGEFVAIMGKSGCGKSTLLNILGGLDQPTDGTYLFDGRNVCDRGAKAMARFRNKTIGYVFQSFHLINELGIIENVALPLGYSGLSAGARRKRSTELLEQVGLKDELHKRPSQLSGGQQQRVAIARALANKPRVILADEPTGNLDSQSSKEIMTILENIHKDGFTVILVTHDLQIAEETTRIIEMSDGQISISRDNIRI